VTITHKASDTEEASRIKELGGKVFFQRVDGVLAVTRSFGDCHHKKPMTKENYVTVDAFMQKVELTPAHKYLILACDGLWDVCSHEAVSQIVHREFKCGNSAEQVADTLVNAAVANDTGDNVTVGILRFNWGLEASPLSAASPPPRPASGPKQNLEVVKQLPSILDKSYYYLSVNQGEMAAATLGISKSKLPCWVPQGYISFVLFKDKGVAALKAVESKTGPFLWATEFANVHTTFTFDEPKIIVDMEVYPGVEQYFQLMKFEGTKFFESAKAGMASADPARAYEIGQKYELRSDWEKVKENVMGKAVFAKFSQNMELRQLLLSTGDHHLVQLKPGDCYWGTGADGLGQNKLGVLLELARKKFRACGW